MHWPLHAAEIAGIALSTTSVAVVYAVMIETGLNGTELGKLILAACFVTDFCTVLALGVLFATTPGERAAYCDAPRAQNCDQVCGRLAADAVVPYERA
ncbi:hypothetical protein KSD_53890 [Ktedonobacter sp. SOSP1-85]|nr:cation:proton antiporter [Ktedonobacter sp. SOSP1-85]GHO77618.1 hypothetical protein KSD_53890 [Ktedonobacter sp. SOSP1-85]